MSSSDSKDSHRRAGCQTSNTPQNGRKGTMWDGGPAVRSPTVYGHAPAGTPPRPHGIVAIFQALNQD